MILASLIEIGTHLVPCCMIGLILLISFLMCDCEHIGETVSRKFCSRRQAKKKGSQTQRSHRTSSTLSSSSRNTSFSLNPTCPRPQPHFLQQETEFSNSSGLSTSTATRPSAPPIEEDNVAEAVVVADTNTNKESEPSASKEYEDPPPSYDDCIRKLKKNK